MKLSHFIVENIEPILVQWEKVARTMIPPSETMSVEALRDHANAMLAAIAADMETTQSEKQRKAKSQGFQKRDNQGTFACAAEHGALRQRVGFDLAQVAGEFRALRATVLRMWLESEMAAHSSALEQVIRFNESVDQAIAESTVSYAAHVASSRDMFLAVLGHDLRNPLGSLSNCIQLLKDQRHTPQNRERTLAIAQRSVASIEGMITDLLEYTRTRLGKGIEVSLAQGDIGELCSEVIEQIRTAYPQQAISAQIDKGLIVKLDRARMRQVLTNLMSNAVHHGDPLSLVSVTGRRAAEDVTVEVRNWGERIPEDQLQVIFDPLVQIPSNEADLPHERPSTSLGLGLFITREIVTAHGGRVDVTSSAQEGTSFKVVLPLATGRSNKTST